MIMLLKELGIPGIVIALIIMCLTGYILIKKEVEKERNSRKINVSKLNIEIKEYVDTNYINKYELNNLYVSKEKLNDVLTPMQDSLKEIAESLKLIKTEISELKVSISKVKK